MYVIIEYENYLILLIYKYYKSMNNKTIYKQYTIQ